MINNTDKLINKHSDRLKVGRKAAKINMTIFMKIVGEAENGGMVIGKNPTSSARGLYQYVTDSVQPALNRLARTTGWQPWMCYAVDHKDANMLTKEQQDEMFLADILEKRGSDKFIKPIMETGDDDAMKGCYMVLHHTDPDASVYANWDRAVKKTMENN